MKMEQALRSLLFIACFWLLMQNKEVSSQGLDEIGCYVAGECLQSLFVEVNRTETATECLQQCKVDLFGPFLYRYNFLSFYTFDYA